AKIDEEIGELRAALDESPARAVEEFGDLLFAIANLARHLGVEPESALREANDKFSRRFAAVEAHFEAQDRTVHGATLEEMERVWQTVKLTAQAAAAPAPAPSISSTRRRQLSAPQPSRRSSRR